MSQDFETAGALTDARALAEAGLVTDREAQAYVLVNVHGWDVDRAADALGVGESRVYAARQAAEERLAAAEETQALLNELRAGDADLLPSTCARCGDGLDEWTVSEGDVVCLNCAGVAD